MTAHPHAGRGALHLHLGTLHAQPDQLGHLRVLGGTGLRLHRVPAPPRIPERALPEGQECREHHGQRPQEESAPMAHRRRILQAAAPFAGQQRHRAEGVRRRWRRAAPPAGHPRRQAVAHGRYKSAGSLGGHNHGQHDRGQHFTGGTATLHAGRRGRHAVHGGTDPQRCGCRGPRVAGLGGDGGGTGACATSGQCHGHGQCVDLVLAQHCHRGQAAGPGAPAILHGILVAAQQPQERGQSRTEDRQAQDQCRANGFRIRSIATHREATAGGVLVTNGSRNIYLSSCSRQLDPASWTVLKKPKYQKSQTTKTPVQNPNPT
ncbi:uncharacterized protein LOC108137538 isoform X6 [Drosophila elegans]|uniref:uncharacterized protein LOC108137538 isoform X6 n=1 Tax=Drosophila elegans TaxID=30023 RepID=UPI001BC85931|nr:uncharacterized protein LOC108137538 isoform X6 [Drosophila elegans]